MIDGTFINYLLRCCLNRDGGGLVSSLADWRVWSRWTSRTLGSSSRIRSYLKCLEPIRDEGDLHRDVWLNDRSGLLPLNAGPRWSISVCIRNEGFMPLEVFWGLIELDHLGVASWEVNRDDEHLCRDDGCRTEMDPSRFELWPRWVVFGCQFWLFCRDEMWPFELLPRAPRWISPS